MPPPYSRYSHHARRALTHAGLLVKRFRHPRIDTGHLLVGVLLTEGSIGHRVLIELQIDQQTATNHLEKLVMALDEAPSTPPHDAALDTALDLAADESAWLGHHYIGTEHLILGITRTNVGNASDLLRQLQIAPEKVRQTLRHVLKEGVTEYSLEEVRHNVRLSELSRRVLNATEQVALEMDHPTVGLGHLLLILLREQRSPISTILHDHHLEEAQIIALLNDPDTHMIISIERVLIQAMEYAQALGSHYIGTEHLALALLSCPEGMALIQAFNISPEEIIDAVGKQLGKRW